MDNWKDSLKVGSIVCINNYGNQRGIRFGVVEETGGGGFLVKMQLDEKEIPIHYNEGYYRRYKYNKIKSDDILVVPTV